MNRLVVFALVCGLLSSPPLCAGNNVRVCEDADGNPSFSDSGCPAGTTKQGRYFAPNAQSLEFDVPNSSKSLPNDFRMRSNRANRDMGRRAQQLRTEQIDKQIDAIGVRQRQLTDQMRNASRNLEWKQEELRSRTRQRQELYRKRSDIRRAH
jgi:hypothetical protein